MKTVTSLFLVALLVASACADCVTRGPVDSFVGDHAVLDSVVSCSGQLQSLALPSTQLGGNDAVTFEVEVFPRAFSGCVFSYGSGEDYLALRFAVDPNNALGQVHFTSGALTVSTEGVVTPNKWHTLAVVIRNNAASATGVNGAVATIYIDGVAYPAGAVGTLSGVARSGSLGYCAAQRTYFNGAVDNLIISAKAKSVQELKDTQSLIYPFVLENDLVQMWTFNDEGETTAAFTGRAASSVATTALSASNVAGAAAVCVREAKALSKYAGARIANKFCQQSGSVRVGAGSTADSILNVAPFQSAEGGLSSTFACPLPSEDSNDRHAFTFNQKWQNGGIIEVTIKTSKNHRFRIAANPGAPLSVDHQSWGGWTRLSTGSGIIAEDRSAFSIGDAEFVIQAANMGWIAVTQAGGFLNYQYALSPAACPSASCDYVTAEEYQYNFQNPPLPEPMGNQQTTAGIQNLPPVLACPDPRLGGYNPFMYCWGWWVGPQVGYVRDWNGNAWQKSDPGCCRNPAITAGNQWSVNNWGHMIVGQKLPWCEDMVVPPIPPPKGTTGVPTYPTDPCEGVDADLVTAFKGTCSGLWGDDQTDGRFIGCVAQLCVTQDPETVPPPDCRTERLLAALDSNHVVPATCNNCPGNCNFRGACNAQALTCTCEAGWTGPDCGQPTTYPCWNVAPNGGSDTLKVLPFQLRTLDPSFPNAPVLTSTMDDPIYTQFAWPGQYKIADTLFIYVTQSVASYLDSTPQYHLWIVSNNGNGAVDVDYQVEFTGAANSELDFFGAASVSGNVGAAPIAAAYPNFNRPVTGTFQLRFTHKASGMSGAVIRKLPATFAGTIRVTPFGNNIPQILIGGTSSSAKAKFDVVKISASAAAAGFALGGSTCTNAPNDCALKNCQQCTASAACGWCVESSQCIKGDATGPAFGECANWRKTFDAVTSRRVTTIPSYPVNPGLTEVYLAQSGSTDLPIEVGITPYPFEKSEWDAVVMTDFGSLPKELMGGQMGDVLSAASDFPNAGISFTSINNGYDTIEPITNPRAVVSLPEAIKMLPANKIAANTGAANVDAAVAALSTRNDLRLRRGTRQVALFLVNRAHDGTAQITAQVASDLLVKNIVPVFAVPAEQMSAYQQIVTAIKFGHVIQLSPKNIAANFRQALAIAGSSISITVPGAEQTTTHIDYTEFSQNIDRFSVSNLPTNFRAKFSVPVARLAGSTASSNDVLTTNLVFPGYGNAVVENIPTTLAEKPWTTAGGKISVLDDQVPVLIELTGNSFRGLMSVVPTITAIPAPTVGTVHYAVRKTIDGEAKWVQGDLIDAGQLPKLVADARVVFVPVGATPAGTPAVLSYTVADKCIASAPGNVEIEVTASNTAPVAAMPNLVTRQFTPLEFTLDFGDNKKSSGGQYRFVVSSTVAARDGALYKWTNNFDKNADNSANLITDGTVLTDARVIYSPPQFKYSTAIRPELLILPCFDYRVEETNESPNLVSNTHQVVITVTHVNVAPYTWEDPAAPTGAANGNILADWAAVDPAHCKGPSCTFAEDFGQQFWWNTGFEYIYLGGADVEGSDLTYEITAVDCFPGTDLKLPLSDIDNAKPGDKIATKFASGDITPAIRFRPARETSNENRFAYDGAAHYCTIGYRVIDDQDAVSTPKTIVIDVTNLNKQPRLEDEVTRIVALEQNRHGFFLSAIDPEDDAFTLSFQGCAHNKGTIELCANSLCESTVTLDCSVVYNAANPTTVPLTGVAVGEKVNGLTAPIQGFFTSGPVATFIEGQEYNTAYFVLADGQSSFPATKAAVIFDVKILNVAPILYIQTNDVDTYSISPAVGTDFLLDLTVADEDFAESEFYIMTVEGTLDNSKTSSARFDVDAMTNALTGCGPDATITATYFKYSCTMAPIGDFLRSVKVLAPQVLAEGEGFVGVKLSVNDNGFVGQCDVPYVTNAPCPLSDEISVEITYVPVADNSNVTVASSAAAAGVAGAAAIAAVALFRKLNKKAEESYQPWDSNEDDDATAVNPLYQESGSKGMNPLFEAKSDL